MAKKYSSKVNVELGQFAILEADGYGTITQLAGLKTSEYAPVVATANIEGDGEVLDIINELTSATLTDTTAGETEENLSTLSGQTIENGEISEGISDNPPIVGRTYIAKLYSKENPDEDRVIGYIAYFCPKVKYAPITDSLTSKTSSGITPSTTTLTGTCFSDDAGKFRYRKSFTTATAYADAQAWCTTKLGGTE
ncbi:hypothetical protein FACS1894132_09690 [Clostridia bacterium]|nr:hypothetical protein FACS1894132_09690 [Clostridia bacterium]